MGDCTVIWVGDDGVVSPHERLVFEPKGKAVGEVMLLLPEGEILYLDGGGEEWAINPAGNPADLVAMQVARGYRASLTITAPVGFGLDRMVKPIERAMKGYRRVKTQDFAAPASSAPADQQAFFASYCEAGQRPERMN